MGEGEEEAGGKPCDNLLCAPELAGGRAQITVRLSNERAPKESSFIVDGLNSLFLTS